MKLLMRCLYNCKRAYPFHAMVLSWAGSQDPAHISILPCRLLINDLEPVTSQFPRRKSGDIIIIPLETAKELNVMIVRLHRLKLLVLRVKK